MPSAQTQLLGTLLQDYVLEDLIGEGGYSWVFRGVNKDLINRRAIKVAKPAELAGIQSTRAFPSRAMVFITGGITYVKPDTSQLLALQSEKIRSAGDPALVHVEEFGIDNGQSFCRMELLEGKTLRALMSEGPVPISLVLHIVRAVGRLAANKKFRHHGDLKPENIVVTADGVKLLDPGHFGPLDCDGGEAEVIITTPEYYPYLTPDDLFALGIMIWEMACRVHPFDRQTNSARIDLSGIGEDLRMLVRMKELIGQYFLSPILECGRPSEVRPGLPEPVEQLCLRALQLRITTEGKIDRGPGFGSYEDLVEVLEGLTRENIRQL